MNALRVSGGHGWPEPTPHALDPGCIRGCGYATACCNTDSTDLFLSHTLSEFWSCPHLLERMGTRPSGFLLGLVLFTYFLVSLIDPVVIASITVRIRELRLAFCSGVASEFYRNIHRTMDYMSNHTVVLSCAPHAR